MALGWSIFRISAKAAFAKMTTLATLIPPPVEPAQAPMNINITKMALDKGGHKLKSVVAKPVVVMMEETWKKAWRRLWKTEP